MHNPTARVINVLNTVSAHNYEYNLSGLSRTLGIPVGTLFPILQTLVEFNYLDLADNGLYGIGMKLFLSGYSFVQSGNSLSAIDAALQDLTSAVGETSHFAKLDNGNVLYLAKIEAPQPIRMYSAIGKTLPAYGTGLGKALLCMYEKDELKKMYPNGLQALTKNTITDFDVLYAQLQEVKSSGFSYECEESNLGVRCIAKPIFKNGAVVAAISVVIPVFRYSEEKKNEIESQLSIAAGNITKIVNYLTYL